MTSDTDQLVRAATAVAALSRADLALTQAQACIDQALAALALRDIHPSLAQSLRAGLAQLAARVRDERPEACARLAALIAEEASQ